jgi:hypothetical protein
MSGGPVGWSPASGRKPPNKALQQTAAAILDSRRWLALSAATAAELLIWQHRMQVIAEQVAEAGRR